MRIAVRRQTIVALLALAVLLMPTAELRMPLAVACSPSAVALLLFATLLNPNAELFLPVAEAFCP